MCVFWKVILEVAMGAASESPERNTTLGVIYDEILRKEVENKCGQLGVDWEYMELFGAVDDGILRKARRRVCSAECCPVVCCIVCLHKGV
jgi:hypothetical protein